MAGTRGPVAAIHQPSEPIGKIERILTELCGTQTGMVGLGASAAVGAPKHHHYDRSNESTCSGAEFACAKAEMPACRRI